MRVHNTLYLRRRSGDDRRRRLGVGQLVLFLPLHASVLEPDLDLSLGETEHVRDLDASAPRQVAVEVELFLELEDLVLGVGGARTLAAGGQARRRPVTAVHTCAQVNTALVHTAGKDQNKRQKLLSIEDRGQTDHG